MSTVLQDPMGIYALTFVIFLVLAFAFGRKPALHWIDSEIAKIRVELDQARQLRAEAEATLADCQAKQARAEAEAGEILNNAKQQAEQLRQRAESELGVYLKRQEQLASERIRLAELEAVAAVRAAAVDEAMAIARKSLKESLSEADAAKLVSHAISDIPALKTSKAKAA